VKCSADGLHLADQLFDAAFDFVADGSDVVNVLASRIPELPVFAAFENGSGAGRMYSAGCRVCRRSRLGEIHVPSLLRDLDHRGQHGAGRGRDRRVGPDLRWIRLRLSLQLKATARRQLPSPISMQASACTSEAPRVCQLIINNRIRCKDRARCRRTGLWLGAATWSSLAPDDSSAPLADFREGRTGLRRQALAIKRH
jgi:hypothetical protein